MSRIIMVGVILSLFAVVTGCQTTSSPVKVKDAYFVSPGQPIGLVAETNAPGLVAEVEVDLSKIDIPASVRTQSEWEGIDLTVSAWLVLGAERAASTNEPVSE